MLIYWNMELPLKATSSFGMVDSRPCKKRKDGAPDLLLGSRRSKARPPAQSGYLYYELESRLLMGEIEISEGQSGSGRAHLEKLEREAQGKGFLFLARKARTALAGR